MEYIVRNHQETCSKCQKGIYGSIFYVRDDIYACIDCAHEYEQKLMPHIGKMVLDFFKHVAQ